MSNDTLADQLRRHVADGIAASIRGWLEQHGRLPTNPSGSTTWRAHIDADGRVLVTVGIDGDEVIRLVGRWAQTLDTLRKRQGQSEPVARVEGVDGVANCTLTLGRVHIDVFGIYDRDAFTTQAHNQQPRPRTNT